MFSSFFGEFPSNIISFIILYIPSFYLSAYFFVSDEWEMAKKRKARLSIDNFLRFIPRCYGIMKKLSGVVEGFYYKAFGIPVIITLLVQFGFWIVAMILDFALDYSAVILIFVAFGVLCYVVYQRSLREKFEQNRINSGILVSTLIADLSDQFDVFAKMRERNMRQVVASQYSQGIKEYIYDTRVTLPDTEFNEDEIKDAVIEMVNTVCERRGWMYGLEPAFEILTFKHYNYSVYITIACKSNEETVQRMLMVQEEEARLKGYKDVSQLQDNDF